MTSSSSSSNAGSTPEMYQEIKRYTAPLFTIPGPAWIAIIGALVMAINAVFPDQPWAPGIVILLGIAAKLIQWWIDYKAGKNPSFEVAILTPPAPAAAALDYGAGNEEYTYTIQSQPEPVAAIAPIKERAAKRITRFLFG